jgi:hypothetical protein
MMNPIDAALVVFGSLLFMCSVAAFCFYLYINSIKNNRVNKIRRS